MRAPASFELSWIPVGLSAGFLALALACSGTVKQKSGDGSGVGGTGSGGASTGGAYGSGGAQGLPGTGGAAIGGCHDTDGDSLSDYVEGYDGPEYARDWDGDLVPDYLDSDSDNDGILDVDEAGEHGPCEWSRNTDNTDYPDFLDEDSDNDGLLDKDEITHGYNHLLVDSDFNGCTDLEEYSFGECDPSNVLVQTGCYAPPGSTEKSIRVSSAIPAGLSDVSLTVTPHFPNQIGVLDVDPQFVVPEGAGKIEEDILESVGPGADVSLLLELESWGASNQFTVRIESVSQGVIAEMQVLWLVEDLCPIFK